ncbi:MAG: tetratricopeptide repeat protein [Candidatus Riflebacteria bacterium]|nr:tetratricopeptide repeat protein [Candidatus Riflebacteria bacterium]
MMKSSFRMWLPVAAVFLAGTLWAGPFEDAEAKAKALFDQGKFFDAATAYKSILSDHRDVLKADPEKAYAVWQGFGESLLKDGRKDQAKQAFARADAHHKRKGETAKNIPEPKSTNMYKLDSLKNDKAQDLYRRGAAFIEEKQYEYAAMEFDKALGIEADNVDLMEIAGIAMAEVGDTWFEKALPLMVKVRAARKDAAMKPAAWLALGRAATHVKKPDFALAEESLKMVLKADPQNFPAILTMGELFLIHGEYKKAIEWFEKAQKIEAANLRVLWGLGDSYAGLKEHEKALLFYSQAWDENPENADAAFRLGVGYKNVGRPDDAIRFHETAIKLDPTKAKYHLGLVEIYLPRIMDFSARKHLDQALALEPDNLLCHYYNGLFLEMRRNIAEAIPEYALAATGGPEMIHVKYQLANIYAAVGNSFPANNFSNENPADKMEYLPYKDVKRAYTLYKEILAINPKYEHAAEIQPRLAAIEELLDTQRTLDQLIESKIK